ncbi:MAG: hypothetical protein Q8P41_04910 [Pseudomonadota bacterium]|nr:hypothetical protein [Pseudomonadota bacterium]
MASHCPPEAPEHDLLLADARAREAELAAEMEMLGHEDGDPCHVSR